MFGFLCVVGFLLASVLCVLSCCVFVVVGVCLCFLPLLLVYIALLSSLLFLCHGVFVGFVFFGVVRSCRLSALLVFLMLLVCRERFFVVPCFCFLVLFGVASCFRSMLFVLLVLFVLLSFLCSVFA